MFKTNYSEYIPHDLQALMLNIIHKALGSNPIIRIYSGKPVRLGRYPKRKNLLLEMPIALDGKLHKGFITASGTAVYYRLLNGKTKKAVMQGLISDDGFSVSTPHFLYGSVFDITFHSFGFGR
jgi:hypothetical protein